MSRPWPRRPAVPQVLPGCREFQTLRANLKRNTHLMPCFQACRLRFPWLELSKMSSDLRMSLRILLARLARWALRTVRWTLYMRFGASAITRLRDRDAEVSLTTSLTCSPTVT